MLLVSLGLSHFRARNGYSIGDTDFQNTCKRLKYGGACRDRTCDHLIKSRGWILWLAGFVGGWGQISTLEKRR